jgi:hypothetical protein
MQSDLAEIYLFEHRGMTMKSDTLLKRYSTLYGSDGKYEAFGAACRGAAKGGYIKRLRILLRQSLVQDNETGLYYLKIPNKDVFNVLWLLAENSTDQMGKEWSSLTQQVIVNNFCVFNLFRSLSSLAELTGSSKACTQKSSIISAMVIFTRLLQFFKICTV